MVGPSRMWEIKKTMLYAEESLEVVSVCLRLMNRAANWNRVHTVTFAEEGSIFDYRGHVFTSTRAHSTVPFCSLRSP